LNNNAKSIALKAYLSEIALTAQAIYEGSPEASGMRRRLLALADEAGVRPEQVKADLASAPISYDGGRW